MKISELTDDGASSIKEKLKSTGASLFYKAVGRDTKPAWGNRIVKDFNDLDYDIPRTFALNQKFKNRDLSNNKRVLADIQKKRLSKKKVSSDNRSELLSERKISSKNKSKNISLRKNNPETIQIGQLGSSSNKFLGLCPFEYEQTIQGKLQKRANHHLSFDKNKVSRIVNQYPIYYNRHADLDFSHSDIMEQRKIMKKYHPFNSYTIRKVFEPRDELDKFFDTDNARKIASPRRMRETIRKFQRVLDRRERKMNESAVLTYETVPCIEKLKKKSVSYSIQSSERQTYFTYQVISDKRGCYR